MAVHDGGDAGDGERHDGEVAEQAVRAEGRVDGLAGGDGNRGRRGDGFVTFVEGGRSGGFGGAFGPVLAGVFDDGLDAADGVGGDEDEVERERERVRFSLDERPTP